jgi:hypothetical protein
VLGKGEQNVKLVLDQISSDGETLILHRDFENFRDLGRKFALKITRLNKWTKAYQKWNIAQKPKASDAYRPFIVAIFPFHQNYRDDSFTIKNIEEYVVEFRKYNELPVLTEDELVDMVMSLQNPFQYRPEETSTEQKWDKLREMIRTMTEQKR